MLPTYHQTISLLDGRSSLKIQFCRSRSVVLDNLSVDNFRFDMHKTMMRALRVKDGKVLLLSEGVKTTSGKVKGTTIREDEAQVVDDCIAVAIVVAVRKQTISNCPEIHRFLYEIPATRTMVTEETLLWETI